MKRFAAVALALISLCGCHVAFSTIGSWSKVSGPPAPANGAWFVPLPDGRVGVFGGSLPSGQPSFDTAIYDPMSGTWDKRKPMPGPAFPDVVAAMGDGTVLVAGGRDAGGTPKGDTWVYDPTGNTWAQVGSLIEPRMVPFQVLLTDGRLMIAGGSVPLDTPEQTPNGEVDFKPISSAEIYDPATKSWSKAGDLNVTRDGLALVALGGGGALEAGGCVGTAGFAPPSETSEVYDPVSNRWSLTTPLPVPICGAGGAVLRDGRALIVDQYTFTGVARYFYQSSDDAFIYDPKTRSWSLTGGLASGGSGVLRLNNGQVLVPELQTGEQSGRTFKQLVGGQIFDPKSNEWNYVTTTSVTMPLIYMVSGTPPIVMSLADGSALVILQTNAIAFHPQQPPPSTQVLDSAGLTFALGGAVLVIVLLIAIAYRRAARADPMKLP